MALIGLCRATGTMVNAQNLDDILKQPCFTQLKKNTRQEPDAAAATPLNGSPAVNTAPPSRQPAPCMGQPSPCLVQQPPAARPMPQSWPPCQPQPPQPLETPFPTMGMHLDQLEAR